MKLSGLKMTANHEFTNFLDTKLSDAISLILVKTGRWLSANALRSEIANQYGFEELRKKHINSALNKLVKNGKVQRDSFSSTPHYKTNEGEPTSVDEIKKLEKEFPQQVSGVTIGSACPVRISEDYWRYVSQVSVTLTNESGTGVLLSTQGRPARSPDDAPVRAAHNLLHLISRHHSASRRLKGWARDRYHIAYKRGVVYSQFNTYPDQEDWKLEFKGAQTPQEMMWKPKQAREAMIKNLGFFPAAYNTWLQDQEYEQHSVILPTMILGVHDPSRSMHGIVMKDSPEGFDKSRGIITDDFTRVLCELLQKKCQPSIAWGGYVSVEWLELFPSSLPGESYTPRGRAQGISYGLISVELDASKLYNVLNGERLLFKEKYFVRNGPRRSEDSFDGPNLSTLSDESFIVSELGNEDTMNSSRGNTSGTNILDDLKVELGFNGTDHQES